ncbi:MAG: hypothetical protein HW387_74 [Parachlamydiales bacterium]|nr:hypothetical protein [Parachlamydiales bacterium]
MEKKLEYYVNIKAEPDGGIHMKTLATILTAVALLTSTAVTAQTSNGCAAACGTTTASDNGFAWGIGLGALAVVGVVVGIAAASASHDQSFSQH